MLDIKQFREELVIPSLNKLNCYSEAAIELLTMTCAHESLGGTYIKQINGSANGIYQMEEDTYEDIWNTYLSRNISKVHTLLISNNQRYKPKAEFMKYNMLFATMMARLHYLRFEEALPEADDIKGLADYYKKYWNTPLGSAKIDDVIDNYYRFTRKEKPAPKAKVVARTKTGAKK